MFNSNIDLLNCTIMKGMFTSCRFFCNTDLKILRNIPIVPHLKQWAGHYTLAVTINKFQLNAFTCKPLPCDTSS